MITDDYDAQDESSKSKSQLKRQMHALQALGESLVDLPQDQFNKFDLPETLHAAILEARRIRQHGARKRQLQYIGRLMRNVDAEAIQQQLDTLLGQSHQATQLLHDVERWRDKLLAEDDKGLGELLEKYPTADRQFLRQLLRNTRKESEANKPPKSARSLFRYLRELLEASA